MKRIILSLLLLQGSLLLAKESSENDTTKSMITHLFNTITTIDEAGIIDAFNAISLRSGEIPESFRDDSGNNLLHTVIQKRAPKETLHFLLRYMEIDKSGLNNEGKTPLDMAQEPDKEALRSLGFRAAAELHLDREQDDNAEPVNEDSYLTLHNSILAMAVAISVQLLISI